MPLLNPISRRAKAQHERGEGSRIPKSLQAVFIASNRGAEVVKPPPRKSAFKMFTSMPKPVFRMFGGKDNCDPMSPQKRKKFFIPANRANRCVAEITVKPLCEDDNIPTSISVRHSPPKKKAPIPSLTPQKYLESLVRSRGYSTECYDVLSSAYYNKPTPLQQASYGVFLVDVVRRNDDATLNILFDLGMHPNACNQFGESIVHLACRTGHFQSLQTMIDCSCNIQVADDYGRTPMHDLCWATEPCFQSAAIVLEIDPRLLFMKDARGSTPLAYARKEHWAEWIRFLESRKDEYWPKRYKDVPQGPPPLTEKPAGSRPLPDPSNALSVKLATLVASGKLSIEEAEVLREDEKLGGDESAEPENCSCLGSEDSEESESDDHSESVSSFFDDDEMDEILGTLKAMKATR